MPRPKRILLVESSSTLISTVSRWLSSDETGDKYKLAYYVTNATVAERVLVEHAHEIDILVVDIYLEGARDETFGLTLAQLAKQYRPDIIIVCMSTILGDKQKIPAEAHFVQKTVRGFQDNLMRGLKEACAK